MREYQRKEFDRPRLNLVRGADGRLKQAGNDEVDNLGVEQNPVPPAPEVVAPKEERRAVAQSERKAKKPRMPHISLPRLKKIQRKHFFVAAAAVAAIALVIAGYGFVVGGNTPQPPSVAGVNVKDTSGPEFEAVLPEGKSIDDLGGWARVSPADKDPVFAYVDKVGNVQLNISQQQLPENLQTNTTQGVERLAEGFAAKEKIGVDGITAYLGTSIRGPQSVIFAKNDLLILIKSSTTLTNQQWADYISSLR